MGKVKNGHIFLSHRIFLELIFTEMFIEKSSMFHMFFVQITEFDRVVRAKNRVIIRKNIQQLPRNHRVDEAVTFHTCYWHYPLHK